MANNVQIYEVVNSNPLFKTVLDYLQDQDSPASQYVNTPDAFLAVQNSSGQTNRQVIEASYTTKFERDHYVGQPASKLKLKVGVRLAIEQQKVNRAGLLTQGLGVVSNNVPLFKAQQLALLETNEGYNPATITPPIQGQETSGTMVETYPDQTVWIWMRSLANSSNQYQGVVVNVTPFVQRISTSQAKDGGNFSIMLPPLVMTVRPDGSWALSDENIQWYQDSNQTSLQQTGFIATGDLYSAVVQAADESTAHAEPGQSLVRNPMFFHTLISPNDLVFIRYETLELEGKQRIQDSTELCFNPADIPGRVYDMIGLVDMNTQAVSPQSNDVEINIVGRDLAKLFIDDGAYFYYLEMSQGMLGGPGSGTANGITQRLSADSALQYLSLYFNNTIENTFKFVINQLSNIKIVPDSLFTGYGNRRNTRYVDTPDNQKYNPLDDSTASLQSQAISSIASIRSDVNLAYSSPSSEAAMDKAVFNELYRFLVAIRAANVRRTDALSGSNTVGWNAFTYTNNRGVQEQIQIDAYPQYFADNLFNILHTRTVSEDVTLIQNIDQIIDITAAKPGYQAPLTQQLMPGIWQIVKLVIDEAVLGRRIIDSSLSSANGPLINFFRKVCQEPLVEFYMDTYGDQFYLTVRKCPTDRASILSELQTQVTTENSTVVAPAVIDIEPWDIIQEELAWADNDVISWYHLTPQANFLGNSDAFSLSYLPAVFLPEYAAIWGARPLQIAHNYLPMMPKDPNTTGLDVAQQQAVEDMRYLIESTAYLPFTRKGSIKINGDRRIKYGNLIRYKATGEIFRVIGVRNDYLISESSIDRTTTIDVERGMVEQLIYGIPAGDGNAETNYFSYFNIVNTTPQLDSTTTLSTNQLQSGTQQVLNPASTPSNGSAYILPPTTSTLPGLLVSLKGNQNLQYLDQLSPSVKYRFVQLVNGINAQGYYVTITSALRSFAQQLALHNANVNNAKPGRSKHNLGLAVDMNLTPIAGGSSITSKSTVAQWQATGIVALATQLGMSWGGNAFVHYYDPVHFVLNATSPATAAPTTEPTYTSVTSATKSLDVAKIFSNFKVNTQVFNFFLQRLQLQQQYMVAKPGYYTGATAPGEQVGQTLTPAVVTFKKAST